MDYEGIKGGNMAEKELKRLENETRLHFIWRMYKYKEDTGKLSQEQAGKICREELNEDYDESAYRKIYQSWQNMWLEVKDEYISEEALIERLSKIDQREDELYKTKVKTADKLREYRKTLRDEARIENIIDTIYEIALNLPEYEYKPKEKQLSGELNAIIQIGDWHFGKISDNYWNKFNIDICKQRVDKLIFDTIKYCEMANVGTLYIVNLNDLIENSIHVTTRVLAEEDAIEQIMHVSELLAYFINELYSYGLNIKYGSVTDNHSRLNKNFKEHIEKESFGKIIDWYLKARLSNLDVEFLENQIDESIGLFELDGKNIFYVHGHLENPHTVVQDLTLGTGIIADIVLMGHYHKKSEKPFHFAKVFINGSLCGVDQYAKSKRLFGKASQTLLVFDNENIMNFEIVLN